MKIIQRYSENKCQKEKVIYNKLQQAYKPIWFILNSIMFLQFVIYPIIFCTFVKYFLPFKFE